MRTSISCTFPSLYAGYFLEQIQIYVLIPVFINTSVESCTIQSSQSFSKIYLPISEGPLPASPENNEEPFCIIAIFPSGASLESPFNTNNCCPSLILGSPDANLPCSPLATSSSTFSVRVSSQSQKADWKYSNQM